MSYCALYFISLIGTPYVIYDNAVYSNQPIPGMTTIVVTQEILDHFIEQNEATCGE
jgi:hypothetical protein